MPANPDPNCPDCRGTGRIELLTSSQPCECTVKPAATAGPSEDRVTRADLVNDPIVAEWCRRVEEQERAHIDDLLAWIQDRAEKDPAGQ